MDRRSFIGTLAGGLLAAPRAAEAQQAGKVPRVGYVQPEVPASEVLREAFLEGLRERGWSDGQKHRITRCGPKGKRRREASASWPLAF
jgi:hypothetical protein